jgi:hypothetical protein
MANSSFSDFMLSQRVIDIVEEGFFRSSVRAPSEPESEISLQPESEIPQGDRRLTGPRLELRVASPPLPGEEVTLHYRPPDSIPMYLGIENKVVPQPRFEPLR